MTQELTEPAVSGAISALQRELGQDRVSIAEVDRLANSRGVWPVELKTARMSLFGKAKCAMPACVVWPENAAEVCTVLRIATEWRTPVVTFGGGSGIVGGTPPIPGSISLDTKRLTSLRIDKQSNVAYAGAGLFGVDFERQLNTEGLSLGHFPQSLNSSTVGGWVATRASGTFSTLHGNIEDRVVGLEVALPGGSLLKTRSSPRSATGPDLANFFIGSEGTLGVITEVALWLHSANLHRANRSFAFPSFRDGLEAVRDFVQAGARPGVVRLYDAGETVHKFANLRLPAGAALLVLIFEGEEELVAGQLAIVERACRESAGTDQGEDPVIAWWQTRFETTGLVAANSCEGRFADAIEVSCLWHDLFDAYNSMLAVARRHNVDAFAHVSHAYPSGAGLYLIVSGVSNSDEQAIEDYQSLVDDLLRACLHHGGSISHHHGIGRGKKDWLAAQHGEQGMRMLAAIKADLDPFGIMNPGVLGLGT